MFAQLHAQFDQWMLVLHQHPIVALIFTFFVAFLESLAIVGSIVPGSVTMTAVGMLAGSGVIRIDATLLVASIGAFLGDCISYAIGRMYRDSLLQIWPFSRYPTLLKYGKSYFSLHGKKSIVIGRFVGPIRSIMPLIAGMMGMQRTAFLSVSGLSACAWSALYVLPGVLLANASMAHWWQAITQWIQALF